MSFDGRNIDPFRGILSGEAARQDTSNNWLPPEVFRSQPSQQTGLTTGDATYYDRPVIKKSPWSWDIPAYYYVGGATGASAALGAAALLLNRGGMPNLIRYVRWIGLAGGGISAFFLIHDLGRPSRFLYMLRVFRPTSPMSMGAYILTFFSGFAGLSWIALFAPRRYRAVGDFAGIVAGVSGLGLAGYTGVLISNTVVPLWQRPHRMVPVLFLASGAASAASLLDFFDLNRAEHRAIVIFGTLGRLGELAASTALERSVATVPEVLQPLRSGFSGALWNAARAFTTASLVFSLWPRSSRKLRLAAGIAGTAGAMCVRFGIHYAGQRSAMNPHSTFHQQRQGQGAFAITGKSAVVGPGNTRANQAGWPVPER
ncbi:MAG: polysulfide reductase NrfD [Acidobacteriota bacterium]|nr:polysulfide reductase NrfD [Acidobacteriota bacterium]